MTGNGLRKRNTTCHRNLPNPILHSGLSLIATIFLYHLTGRKSFRRNHITRSQGNGTLIVLLRKLSHSRLRRLEIFHHVSLKHKKLNIRRNDEPQDIARPHQQTRGEIFCLEILQLSTCRTRTRRKGCLVLYAERTLARAAEGLYWRRCLHSKKLGQGRPLHLNHINCPDMLIWLGDAAGVQKSLVNKAKDAALAVKTEKICADRRAHYSISGTGVTGL